MALPCSYCERLKAREKYNSYFSRRLAALLYEYMMRASSWVKYSGGKIVPHSDLRAGTSQEDVVIKKIKIDILRVGAWNVLTLNRVAKLENLKREMDRLKLDMIGISEVQWQDEQDFWSGEYRVINTKLVVTQE